MKIIEAISDMNIGGAGVLLVTRLRADKDMRDRTVVVLPKGSMLIKRMLEIGVRVIEVEACRDRSFDVFAIPKYVRIIKQVSPDTVNCHGCLSFRIAALLCGVPVRIYTRHCAFPIKEWQKNFILKSIVGRFQMILSNGIIAVVEAAKNDLVDMGVDPSRVRVIINGVKGLERFSEDERLNIRRSLSIPRDAVVVGIFARLEAYKGHMDLIEAASILLSYSDKYRFLIVGGGSLEKMLKDICKKKGIYEKFIFTGFVDDVTTYFNVTDINVNCSHGTETSSLALSEGMSLGIPCIASDFGGNGYMVQNDVNGFVYPVYDGKRLAVLIEKISDDGALRERLSRNAYMRFSGELNDKKMTEATYSYYTQLRSVKAKGLSGIHQNS